MKPKYHKHIFICTNDRGPNHPRGDCANCGGTEFWNFVNSRAAAVRVRAKHVWTMWAAGTGRVGQRRSWRNE